MCTFYLLRPFVDVYIHSFQDSLHCMKHDFFYVMECTFFPFFLYLFIFNINDELIF